jgi:two-component system cell cycle sensor histidine kinase/response regulator CckA
MLLEDVAFIGAKLFTDGPVGVFVFDRTGQVVRANDAMLRLLGSPDEKTTKLFNVFTLPTLSEKSRQALRAIIDSGEQGVIDIEYLSMHGKKTALFVTVLPVKDGDETTGAICHAVDNTAMRETMERVKQGGKMESLTLMAGSLAHDLNNIFTTIIGFASLLGTAEGSLPPERRTKGLAMLQNAANSGAQLVEQLVSFTSERAARTPACRFAEAFDRSLSLFSFGLPRELAFAQQRGPDTDVLVRGSTGKLEQIFLNVLINARDAVGKRPGRIEIAARTTTTAPPDALPATPDPPSGYVAVRITDTGMGIAPENLDRIFDPYFTTKPEGKGMGLGLSSVWGILNELGGRIRVESGVGEGATFEIFLPVATSEDREPGEDAPRIAALVGAGQRILVVEQDPSLRTLLVWVLLRNGYKALEAESGERAASLLADAAQSVECVVVDLGMPLLHLDMFHNEIPPALPVLYLVSPGRRIPARDPSMALRKPFSPQRFLEQLGRLLGSGKAPE